MRRLLSWAVIAMALMVVACGKKHDDNAVNPNAPVPPKSVINDENKVEMDAAKLYGNMQFIMANQEEDQKNYTVMDVFMGDVGGHFRLDKSEKNQGLYEFLSECVKPFGITDMNLIKKASKAGWRCYNNFHVMTTKYCVYFNIEKAPGC